MSRWLRLAGVAAVAVLWTTLPAGTVLAGFDLLGDDPLSYLGTQGPSEVLFTAGLAVSALLLVAFHQYVRHRYRISRGFSPVMLLGLAGQLVAAFVPIGGDPTSHRIHTASALLLGASLPLFMWQFAAAQPVGSWRRLAYGLFWAEAAACTAGLYLSSRNVAPIAEILPAAVFHAWIVVLTVGTAAGGRSVVEGGRQVAVGEPGLDVEDRRAVEKVDPAHGQHGAMGRPAAARG